MAQKLTFDRFGVDLQVPTDIRPLWSALRICRPVPASHD